MVLGTGVVFGAADIAEERCAAREPDTPETSCAQSVLPVDIKTYLICKHTIKENGRDIYLPVVWLHGPKHLRLHVHREFTRILLVSYTVHFGLKT